MFLTLTSIPIASYIFEANKEIRFATKEQYGIKDAKALLHLIQATQQHRGLTALRQEGSPDKERSEKAHEVFQFQKELQQSFAAHGNPEEIALHGEQLHQWEQLADKIERHAIDQTEQFHSHNALIALQLKLLKQLLKQSQLILDPEPETYFLIAATLDELPRLTEILGQLRAIGTLVIKQGDAVTPQELQTIAALLASADMLRAAISVNISETLSREQIKHYSPLIDSINNSNEQTNQITQALFLSESEPKNQNAKTAENYYKAYTNTINLYFNFAYFAADEIERALADRKAEQSSAILKTIGYFLLAISLGTFLFFNFARSLLMQLGGDPRYASQIVQAISKGDLNVAVKSIHNESLLANIAIMQTQLKENIRLKSQFVSTVSHELRTPLTTISSVISIILVQASELPKPLVELLEMGKRNAARLNDLINDLLDIEKLESGQLTVKCSIQKLKPILKYACESINGYAEKFSVSIFLNNTCEDALVNVDSKRLEQVLLNLLSNAIKYSPAQGQVTVSTEYHDKKIRINVIDNGEGIPLHFHSRIFQKFSQADSSDSRKVNGTGLGLAITKDLIELMDGAIGFTTSTEGTCFYVDLPRATDPELAAPETTGQEDKSL